MKFDLPVECREVVVSSTGEMVAFLAFDKDIVVGDLRSGTLGPQIRTVFDFGGHRVALSHQLNAVYAGAFSRHGLCSYDAVDGSLRWQKRPLWGIQVVTTSFDGKTLFVEVADRGTQILSASDGTKVGSIRGGTTVVASPYGDVLFVGGDPYKLLDGDFKKLASIQPRTFSHLAASFAPEAVFVSHAAGEVGRFELPDAQNKWNYSFGKGWHAVQLAYFKERDVLACVVFEYEVGGNFRLAFLDATSGALIKQELTNKRMPTLTPFGESIVWLSGEVVSTTYWLS